MPIPRAALSALALLAAATTVPSAAAAGKIKHVFVVAMENQDASTIYAGAANTPYINSLLATYAHAAVFLDDLPAAIPSEPHYLWMEGGANVYPDHVFKDDSDPSATNSTASHAHLIAQLRTKRIGWMSYEEGVNGATGACPVRSSGLYGAKHNPFVFFQDVAGSPPSARNAYCRVHTRPISRLATDLANNTVVPYVSITPNLCDDMHGAPSCPGDVVAVGDQWLSNTLPAVIAWANTHAGVVFLTWDEPVNTRLAPFIAIGPGVKVGYASGVVFNHRSMVKSVERIFGLPFLPTVARKTDFADLFTAGQYP